ncbi:M23 family metallopeptidase [Paenibacillus ottowii]|uniref:Peptidoglycan DD-metalloendopeptidase family protein n=1 Tax=Paenibacillus ottowii TaxID=2315729 RepID=A0ABY3BBA5_9BACL|nr:M23 family metallopeptidase [Paenibacillus ottowii]TQS01112.1 peptidoglycan DD-metalloendopeptidase family protein [Paenibacillus ottowii]
MKKGSLNRRMTLLVIRDAQQPPKQLQCSTAAVILVPTLVIASISTLVIGLQIRSSHIISQMETNLAVQSLQMEVTVADKDAAIGRLRQEVMELTNQATSIRERLQRVTELEQQMQQFIRKYGNSSSTSSHKSTITPLSWNASDHIGGELIAVHENTALLASQAMDDFQEIEALLDTVERTVPRSIQQANAVQQNLERKQAAQLLQTRRLELTEQGRPSIWPAGSRRMTSSFGYRSDPFTGRSAFHSGVDIAGQSGDPVYAAGAGTVLEAASSGARGKCIIIQHPDGLQSWYMHLSGMQVAPGDRVHKGQTIGLLGSTGRSTGPHLHFQIVKHNQPVDPLLYVQ